jgi:hypothetical protein
MPGHGVRSVVSCGVGVRIVTVLVAGARTGVSSTRAEVTGVPTTWIDARAAASHSASACRNCGWATAASRAAVRAAERGDDAAHYERPPRSVPPVPFDTVGAPYCDVPCTLPIARLVRLASWYPVGPLAFRGTAAATRDSRARIARIAVCFRRPDVAVAPSGFGRG